MLSRGFKLLLPPACPLCGQTFPVDWDSVFCERCLAGILPLPPSRCSRCSLPFAGTENSSHLCGRCIQSLPPYQEVFAVGLYEQALRRAVHQFKFNDRVGLDLSLGKLLERAVNADKVFDLVIPVPLSRQRLRQRCYNQALLLARQVAGRRNLPLAGDQLIKIRETEAQQSLSAREREKNLRGVFEMRGSVFGKRILLIDDVMTTGTTVACCSRVLIEHGAAEVAVAVLARAG